MLPPERYFCAHMTRIFTRYGLVTFVAALLLTGCTINRDIMFRTARDYQFDAFTDTARSNLRLQPNDMIQFRLFANDGFKMIDLVSEGGGREASFIQRTIFDYYIESDGMVKLPLLGRVKVAGYTLRQAEAFLEEKYTSYYKKPYVQLMVSGRKVVVFPGGGGDAKSITLENNNTSLLEVIGMAGGINPRGNASKVKVFRLGPDGQRLVYQFDLSDISGLPAADMVMQGDDVVYVQPNPELAREAIADLTPLITLLSSVLLVLAISRNIR